MTDAIIHFQHCVLSARSHDLYQFAILTTAAFHVHTPCPLQEPVGVPTIS